MRGERLFCLFGIWQTFSLLPVCNFQVIHDNFRIHNSVTFKINKTKAVVFQTGLDFYIKKNLLSMIHEWKSLCSLCVQVFKMMPHHLQERAELQEVLHNYSC